MIRSVSNRELAEGAHNLLINCAGVEAGQSLLVIAEDPGLGWYDSAAPLAVVSEAKRLGLDVAALQVGGPENDADEELVTTIRAHDVAVFFARIGDQSRFEEPYAGTICVMSYARTADALAGLYGRTPHQAFGDLKQAVNAILLGAGHIEITCPLGTSLSGSPKGTSKDDGGDVSVLRFPLGVPQPVLASTFSGHVAVARFLTPTGSRSYEPASVALQHCVLAEIRNGRIAGYDGEEATILRIERHYTDVSAMFGIDGGIVHSWHAGIHPGSTYSGRAEDDPDRWSNTVFTHPRFLHFHTCGDYAPGEICWLVLDHTVAVDGIAMWDKGRLRPDNFASTTDCVSKWPELAALFAAPSEQIGL